MGMQVVESIQPVLHCHCCSCKVNGEMSTSVSSAIISMPACWPAKNQERVTQINEMRIRKKKPKGKQPDSVINAIVT